MKIFVCYTIRDKRTTTNLLKTIDNKLSKNNEIYIDKLHNTSKNQKELFVIKKPIREISLDDLVTNKIKALNL